MKSFCFRIFQQFSERVSLSFGHRFYEGSEESRRLCPTHIHPEKQRNETGLKLRNSYNHELLTLLS